MKRQREILTLLISAFIVVIAWVIANIYHNAYASTINSTLSEEIIPISPNFNTAVLEKLKTRKYIDPIYTFPANTDTTGSTTASSSSYITPVPTVILQSSITDTTNATHAGVSNQ